MHINQSSSKVGGHITLLFSIQSQTDDVDKQGSRGAGICIEKGVEINTIIKKGNGYSIIDGRRFDWTEKDIFCVPSWTWHEHCNNNKNEDSCLFSFNDLPVMQKLGFYKEQPFPENNGHQIVEN